MERQILEINAAFNAYVDDASAIENDLEKRLRSAESQLVRLSEKSKTLNDRNGKSKNGSSTLRGGCANCKNSDGEGRQTRQPLNLLQQRDPAAWRQCEKCGAPLIAEIHL